MRKIKNSKILIALLILLSVILSSTQIYALNNIDFNNVYNEIDTGSTITGMVDATSNIQDITTGVLAGVQLFAIIVTVGWMAIFILIPIIVLIVRIRKKYTLEQSIKQGKTNVIISLILILICLLFGLYDLSDLTDYSIITGILVNLFAAFLLFLADREYKTTPLRGVELGKIVSIFLLVNFVLSALAGVIAVFVSGVEGQTLGDYILTAVLNISMWHIIIPMFLLLDAVRIPKKIKEEEAQKELQRSIENPYAENIPIVEEDVKNKNMILYIMSLVIIVANVGMTGIAMHEYVIKQESLKELFSEMLEGTLNTDKNEESKEENSFYDELFKEDEELFNKSEQAAENYQNNLKEEQEAINDLLSMLQNNIDASSQNQVSNNVSNTLTNEITNNVLNNNINQSKNSNQINNEVQIPNTETKNIPGDVNMDSKITMVDLSLLKNHIIKNKILEGEGYFAADLNGDGAITVTDLANVKMKVVGMK